MKDAIKKFIPQNFNDLLALILVFLIPAIWILQGQRIIELPDTITGATISAWTIVILFYFRKKSGGD